MAKEKPANIVTVYGRLSYPTFKYSDAVLNNQRAPKNMQAKPGEEKPSFNLLLEEAQLDKLVTHIKDVFLPWVAAEGKLDPKKIKVLLNQIDSDWEVQPPHILIKPVSEKSQELMPTAVASINLKGQAGRDIELRAIVKDEDQLKVNDGSIVTFPLVLPIEQTVHEMYPGALVAATINLYVYDAPGLSGGANVAIFKEDAERFGGGVDVDEDDLFLDD